MGSDAGKRIGATGRRDAWTIDPAVLYSPRSDPKHEEHDNWLSRTDPNDPEMAALLTSMRENGTDEGTPIIVYSDGGKTCIAAGDRRTAACLIVNRERKANRQPPLLLRALTTKDPVAARALENACRKEDPPLVLARRYRTNAATMGEAAAAAACGLTLAYANALVACLALPADIQAKVNAREIPPDVAARMGKAGSEKAREIVKESTGADGKVDEKKARKAAQTATKRARGITSARLGGIEGELRRMSGDLPGYDEDDEVARCALLHGAALMAACVRGELTDPPAWLAKAIESAKATRKVKAKDTADVARGEG